jgi:undecaprenyl-diphosphatase
MANAAPEQKREINQRARSHGGPDAEANLGASGTQVEDARAAVRPGDRRNGPSRRSGESFLAHPAHALWAAGGMLATVVVIAILVPAGPLGVDRSWSDAMHHLETPLLTDLALIFNWAGRGLGRALTLTLFGSLLLRRRRWLAFVALAVTESLAPVLSTLLKVLVDRARPPNGLVHPVGASFPSGHATYAGATSVVLVLLFTTPGTNRRWWWTLASLGVVGMAWSRTYLQVHWLTDVIAGALLGSGISLLVFALAQLYDSRVADRVLSRRAPVDPLRSTARSATPRQEQSAARRQLLARAPDDPAR